MIYTRRTLAIEARFEGLGLHCGEPVRVRVLPGEAGLRFISGGNRFEATPDNVTETARCTRLGDISTIEHLMSALAGLEVTDADIEVVGGELPALDGSSRVFCQGLVGAGFASLGEAEISGPFTRIFVQEPDWSLAVSAGEGHWRYSFDAGDRWPGVQTFESPDVSRDYQESVAPARTFGFETEVEAIRAAGLAKGLDLESALLIGSNGYANAPRFPDEPARHKLLDAIGDLYLAGIPIRFLNVAAYRAGHTANIRAATLLRSGG
ncbi:MAG: UDP-3-O-acyl-N-acetylglucosamine deacetylase [Fimbriimonadaceae bacterium]